MAELGAAGRLRHYDSSQLWFQIDEIFGERTYLRHGVTVGEGAVVLDVGANVGVAAVFFAEACGATAVHSFEPIPPLYELLRENVGGLAACEAHNYGLGPTATRDTFTYYPGAGAMSGRHADPDRDREFVRGRLLHAGRDEHEADRELEGRFEPIELECDLRALSDVLSELEIDRVDLLKIDVERSELDVLAGLRAADWPAIRQLVVEVHDEDGRLDAIAGLLAERGFEVSSDQDEAMRGTTVRMLYAIRR